MRLPIVLQGLKKTINTSALIDSGATGNFMDPRLLPKGIFKLTRIPTPITAYNVDGTPNIRGTIQWIATVPFSSGTFTDTVKFMVARLSRPQVILGMPWLQKWNPKIDWTQYTIDLRTSSLESNDHLVTNALNPDNKVSQMFSQRYPQGVERTLRERPPSKESNEEQVNKVTISMEIAMAEKLKEIPIPDFCTDFADVISEKTYNQLPPHRTFDHAIDLKDTFVPKIAKVYPLNPAEKEACKAFIKEHLKTGRIVPSKSPQASPFFFVLKKDGTLRPCQDYRYLNSHTICNVYPLPLISELVDDMKDSTYFTKFDVRWGYNNIRIKKSDQWKAAFITPLGLFEPTVMFFGFYNAPPTFQAFMNHIFADMIAELWLKIYMDDLGIHTNGTLALHHD